MTYRLSVVKDHFETPKYNIQHTRYSIAVHVSINVTNSRVVVSEDLSNE